MATSSVELHSLLHYIQNTWYEIINKIKICILDWKSTLNNTIDKDDGLNLL